MTLSKKGASPPCRSVDGIVPVEREGILSYRYGGVVDPVERGGAFPVMVV